MTREAGERARVDQFREHDCNMKWDSVTTVSAVGKRWSSGTLILWEPRSRAYRRDVVEVAAQSGPSPFGLANRRHAGGENTG
jgi:hypothetical protein